MIEQHDESTGLHFPETVSDRPRVVLDVIAGPHAGARFEFDRHETFLIGRAPGVSLQLLEDPFFSRHHLLIEFNPPRCYLRDLGSSNGTMVNGRKVDACDLSDRDVISGGNTEIRVSVLPGAASTVIVPPAAPTPPTLLAAGAPRTTSHATSGLIRLLAHPVDEPPAIPGFEIIRLLGRGGMGEVYLAREQATGRARAVKVVLPDGASERTARLFLREASVLSRLDHPRIVRFHEMGLAGDRLYFAMEYVDSVSSAEYLSEHAEAGRIRAACTIAAQVLEGLAYAHSLKFVHRDIKPANVLLARCGDAVEAKLADFGLAKDFENAGFSGITREGQIVGTLAFMAPEQVINSRYARPSVDIYGIGATLYQWICGRPPIAETDRSRAMKAILEDEPDPLTRLCPVVPVALSAVVHRAMAKTPPERYPTAGALRAALLPFCDQIPSA
jgi:serine/threonine-protein kinase